MTDSQLQVQPQLGDDLKLAALLLELAKKYDAGTSWELAFADSIEHILLVAKNNPNKNLKEILLRPDVQEAITEPFVKAGVDTIEAVRVAWLQAAGIDAPVEDLNKILVNVRANTKSAPARVRAAVLHGPREEMAERLGKVAKDMRLRAEYAVQYAQQRGATVKLLHDAKKSKGKKTKTWVNQDPQCSACQALAGVTIPIDALFDSAAGGLSLGTFGDLIGPPRHPNCGCKLVIN